MDARYDQLIDLARTRGLQDKEQLQYLRAMVSEKEIDKVARAYLRRGREEGERKEREKHRAEILRIAKNFLDSGVSVEDVARNTGLSPEEVEALKS